MSPIVGRVERIIFQYCKRDDDQPGHYMLVAEAVIAAIFDWQPMETAPFDGTEVYIQELDRVMRGRFLVHPDYDEELDSRPGLSKHWWEYSGGSPVYHRDEPNEISMPSAWMPIPEALKP